MGLEVTMLLAAERSPSELAEEVGMQRYIFAKSANPGFICS